jgi:hypothetical protein
MVRLGTFCSQCCFYDSTNKSCAHKLLDVFQSRDAQVEWHEDGPSIDRICQYRRNHEWNEDKTIEEKIKLCQDHVYLTGTIAVLANNKDSLLSTITKLNSNPKISNFKFIIIYTNIKQNDLLDVCGNNINGQYKLVYAANNNINFQIYKSLVFAKNGYLFILDSNKIFDDNIIDKINYVVNKKLFRLLHVPGTDGLHQSVSMVHIYKWLKGDLEVEFKNKLEDISEQEKSDAQILTWKEINEEYSN